MGNPLGDKGSLESNADFDSITDPGIYAIGAGNGFIPNSSPATLLVIKNKYGYISQIRLNDNGYIHARTKSTGDTFPNWSTYKPV